MYDHPARSVAVAGPQPHASSAPSPSTEPSRWPEPSLHVNGLATVAREGVRLWVDPANGDPGPRKKFLALTLGAQVLLVDGPVTVDGIDYWQVYPSTRDYRTPLGWIAATKGDGTANLNPFQPACPAADGITAAQIAALDQLVPLSCFGNRELTLDGALTCNFGIGDGILGGPMLNATEWCLLDESLGLFGSVITTVPPRDPSRPVFSGHYTVSGHFDDPGAQGCIQIPFATPMTVSCFPGDPGAIQTCRGFFVGTAAFES